MSLFYSVLYRLGFTPWEEAATYPSVARKITALFEREEAEREPPYGRALDLGCGRGHWAVVLAWRPAFRGPLPRGASREEIEEAFAGWKVIDEEPVDATGLPRPLRKVDPRIYRLRRD